MEMNLKNRIEGQRDRVTWVCECVDRIVRSFDPYGSWTYAASFFRSRRTTFTIVRRSVGNCHAQFRDRPDWIPAFSFTDRNILVNTLQIAKIIRRTVIHKTRFRNIIVAATQLQRSFPIASQMNRKGSIDRIFPGTRENGGENAMLRKRRRIRNKEQVG